MTERERLVAVLRILRDALAAPRMDWRGTVAEMEAVARRPIMPVEVVRG